MQENRGRLLWLSQNKDMVCFKFRFFLSFGKYGLGKYSKCGFGKYGFEKKSTNVKFWKIIEPRIWCRSVSSFPLNRAISYTKEQLSHRRRIRRCQISFLFQPTKISYQWSVTITSFSSSCLRSSLHGQYIQGICDILQGPSNDQCDINCLLPALAPVLDNTQSSVLTYYRLSSLHCQCLLSSISW